MPTLAINHDALKLLCKWAGIHPDYAQMARTFGVDPATVHRVIKGKNAPSARFIAGALLAFGHARFSELFQIVPDEKDTK